jgi:hypothetical protein
LIATYTGNSTFDFIGRGSRVELTNGNVIMASSYYGALDQNGYAGYGAITWFNGTTGKLNTDSVGGVINQTNSLVGANYGNTSTNTYGDQLGSGGILALANGNALVGSPYYGMPNGGSTYNGKGAITWVDGSTGKFKDASTGGYINGGSISSTNSLMGAVNNDRWGDNIIATTNGYSTILSSGNVLYKGNGGMVWIAADGSTAQGGLANGNAHVFYGPSGSFKLATLSDGNFVLGSASGNSYNGYAVWVNGSTGLTQGGVDHLNYGDTLTSTNALIGDSTYTGVGSSVLALDGGRYVVMGTKSATWVDASTGNGTGTNVAGTVGTANSFTGYNAAPTGYKLSNGNYVLASPSTFGGVSGAGVVTWFDGATGHAKGENSLGAVLTASNSLYGTTTNDSLGNYGITALSNGNYVVRSAYWDNGTATDAGAVTWGNGTSGVAGAVSSTNSLVGSTASDQVGDGGTTELSNGNYLVSSPYWNGYRGALTWVNGTTGVVGVVSSSNSLVGSTVGDYVGQSGYITLLSNGNYVLRNPYWDNAGVVDAGAVTWGSATTGVSGVVSSSNSLVGTRTSDQVGMLVVGLSNGNYVVASPFWDSGPNAADVNVGAATWANGSIGITGTINASNSLIGNAANVRVGGGGTSGDGIKALPNGNYVVLTPGFSNTAATWGNGSTGITGLISTSNSFTGGNVGSQNASFTVLADGNYLISEANASVGGTSGIAIWFNASNGFALGETTVGATASQTNALQSTVQYSNFMRALSVGANAGGFLFGRSEVPTGVVSLVSGERYRIFARSL